MNWTYVVPRLVLTGLLWAFFAWGFDPASRRGLEIFGEQALGGRVEIANLATTFAHPSLTLSRVALADRDKPMTNLVEFDELRIELAGRPLLHRNFVIEEARLSGLRWNTPRAEPGALEDWKPLWKRRPTVEGFDLDLDFDLDEAAEQAARQWLDELIERARAAADPNRFESVQVAQALEREWPARFDGFDGRVEDLENRIEALKGVRDVKGKPLERIEAYQKAAAELQRILADAQQLRREIEALPDLARRDFARLNDAKTRDLAALRETVAPLTLDGEALSDALLGGDLRRRLSEALVWAKRVREFSRELSAEVEPVRGRGVDIVFARRPDVPRFLLRRLAFDGAATLDGEPVTFAGTLADVASDPRRHGTPVTWSLEASGRSTLALRGRIDRTGDAPADSIDVAWTLPSSVESDLGDPRSFALRLAADRTVWRARIEQTGDTVRGTLTLQQSPVRLAIATRRTADVAAAPTSHAPVRTVAAESADPLESILDAGSAAPRETLDDLSLERLLDETLAGTLGEIRSLEASLSFESRGDRVAVDLDSGLGEQLATGLRGGLTAAVARQREILSERLDGELTDRVLALRKMMGERYTPLLANLTARESAARTLTGQLAGSAPLDVRIPTNSDDLRDLKSNLKDLRDPLKLLRPGK